MNRQILLDTNMLLAHVQFRAAIYVHGSFTLSSCIKELEKLLMSKKKLAIQSKVALEVIKRNKLPIAKTTLKGDHSILSYAIRNKCAVATNDRILIKKLKNKGIRVYRLRQKKYMVKA